MLTYDVDLKRFMSQAIKMKYFPIYIGSDGWGSNISIGYGMNGDKLIAYKNNYCKENVYGKLLTEFIKTYTANYHENPNFWSSIGFDSAWVAFLGLSKVNNNFSADNIRNQISKLKSVQLVTTNNFSFSNHNYPNKDVYIFKLSQGGANYIPTLKSNA